MCAIDRTAEYHRLLVDLGDRASQVGAPRQSLQQTYASNDLYQACSTVGGQLEQMQGLITELHKHVQKKSVFDDQSAKSDALILQINNSNSGVSDSISKLENVTADLAKSSSSDSIKAAVNTLKIRHRDALLDFQRACELRNKNLIQKSKVKQKYTPNRPAAQAISGMDVMDADEYSDLMNSGGSSRRQGQIDPGYSQDRLHAMKGVQKAINEIAQMFKNMSDMVEMQDEQIMRIDHDIDETTSHLDTAEKDLYTYLRNISGNRALILKVFGIVIFFIVFFVMFLT